MEWKEEERSSEEFRGTRFPALWERRMLMRGRKGDGRGPPAPFPLHAFLKMFIVIKWLALQVIVSLTD